MTILDLSLTYKWFDMIASGEKKEEYREIKDYWLHRLTHIRSYTGKLDEILFEKQYDWVRFHRGQGGRQTMLIECKGISVGYGNTEWGAPADREVFIIKLGNRINV